MHMDAATQVTGMTKDKTARSAQLLLLFSNPSDKLFNSHGLFCFSLFTTLITSSTTLKGSLLNFMPAL